MQQEAATKILTTLKRFDEARAAIETLMTISAGRYVPSTAFATVYAGLGDTAKVFEWFERASDARDVNLIFLPVDPRWQPYEQSHGSGRSWRGKVSARFE